MFNILRTNKRLKQEVESLKQEVKTLQLADRIQKQRSNLFNDLRKESENKVVMQGQKIAFLEAKLHKQRDPKTGRYLKKN